ncbi:DUF7563 family protein [Halopenitus persicus]|uniref:DUF7563 family protein n=1 Tax=Halopenitus persicus TaxID=1048396 RepID=UPI000BBA7296|nr:zinc ribbon domain-containing protein [Halopenitus persicus]
MSKTQSTFADFEADDAADESDSSHSVDTDAATPTNQPDDTEDDEVEILPELLADDSGTQCKSCGQPVSDEYARVAGDNSGEVHSCPRCNTVHENLKGATAGVERDDGETLFEAIYRDNAGDAR